MSFEDLLRSIKGRREGPPERADPGRPKRRTPLDSPAAGSFGGSLALPVPGNLREEADFVLRTPLKNYFMHELADQTGAPGVWRDEFEIIIDNILRCDSFFIEPAKAAKYKWEQEICIQQMGFAAVSRSRIESYLIDMCGDMYVCDTDLCDFVKDSMSFGEFVQAAGAVVPSIRLFAGEYFFRTSGQRLSLEPFILVFGLPPEVRPMAALALEFDKRKSCYSPSLNRDHVTARTARKRVQFLSESLTRAVPSVGSLVEVAKSYRIKELKPVMRAYRELYMKYLSVWVRPAPEITIRLGVRAPKVIGGG